MEKQEILSLAAKYGVKQIESFKEIDSSKPGDFRLNILIDKRYVLRINDPVITEARLAAIDRLAGRYCASGIRAPRLFKSADGTYLTRVGERVCYLSEYLDLPTLDTVRDTLTAAQNEAIERELLRHIGRFAREYSDVDLQPVMSMWSIIDLAPLDVDIDEKQDNLNLLVKALSDAGEHATAERVSRFNEANRKKILEVFRALPRCVIQGDLNDSNILVSDGKFAGIIDFNMAGTEVNVNTFCCEANEGFDESDLETRPAEQVYAQMSDLSEQKLRVILEEYRLNDVERRVIRNYWNLVTISQYPNVCQYLRGLKNHRDKTLALIECVINQSV